MNYYEQVFLVLIARYRQVLYVMVGTIALTVLACVVLPPRYAATATVLVDSKPDPIASVMISTGMVPNIAIGTGTEIDIITSERVARRVVTMLKLDQDPKVKEEWQQDTDGKGSVDVWLGPLLLKKLTVKQGSMTTNVLPIKFESRDPDFAAAVANAFAQAYVEYSVQRKVEPAKQYAQWFAQQEKVQREALASAQEKLSKFQQDKVLVAKDEQLDDEYAKLTQLTQQLAVVQGNSADASSRNATVDAEMLPDVATSPVLTSLKADIARQEGKLQEAAVNLGKNHPQYQRMTAEIESLKDKLRLETRNVTSGFAVSLSMNRKKESELRSAIEVQKRKLLQIKGHREELAVLQREVDAAKKTYDGVVTQMQQSRLDSQSNQSNVQILTPAVPPLEPSFPKLVLFTLLSIPLGVLLGAGAVYLLELADPHVRSTADLIEVLKLPVLGVIEAPRARARFAFPWRRRAAFKA